MIAGFKSLSGERKTGVIMGGVCACLLYMGISLILDTMLFGKGNYVNPDISKVDTIDKLYIIDGKTYKLKQNVTLVDGKIVVETIKE